MGEERNGGAMSDFWYEMLEGFVFVVCCVIIIAALIVMAP